jgi:hypothetical protein
MFLINFISASHMASIRLPSKTHIASHMPNSLYIMLGASAQANQTSFPNQASFLSSLVNQPIYFASILKRYDSKCLMHEKVVFTQCAGN